MALRVWLRSLRALLAPRRVERELDDELAFHVARETVKLVEQGVSPDDARVQALARFGSRTVAADACRDERATAGVDTFVRDLVYALRTWRRAPLAAVTIVLTVALGLGLVTIAFTFYSAVFLRTDAVPHPEELFELHRPQQPGADTSVPFTHADYETFRSGNTVFTEVAAAAVDPGMRIDGRTAVAMLVSGSFFRMAGVSAARGRTVTADDDRAGAPPVIVLSERRWARLFARDSSAIGRTARVNGVLVEIVGVMPAGFRGLRLGGPDFWAPLAADGLFRDVSAGRERPIDIIGRLRPNVSEAEALAAVRHWAAGPGLTAVDGRPLVVTLRPRTGVSPDTGLLEMLAFGAPLFFVFGIILLIACANVASLLLARGIARQREMGVRLSLGAPRRRLVRQLLTEGLVLGAAAAALAYPISRLSTAGMISVVLRSIPPEFAEQVDLSLPAADWRVLVFLVVGAFVATAMFGLMPALQATRLDPVRTMRGEVLQDARPGRVRRALMVAQVCASTLLLICAAIFLRSAFTAAGADPGVRVADTLRVALGSESNRTAVLDALSTDPLVTMISASSDLEGRSIAVTADETGIVAPQTYQFVSGNHFSLLDIGLLRGRAFTASERSLDSGVVIVSARTAETLWPGTDPIGRAVRMAVPLPGDAPPAAAAAPAPERRFTVVGVVGDRRSIGGFNTGAGLYVPTAVTSPGARLLVRVNEEPMLARSRLLDRLVRADPALSSVRTMRSIYRGLETILRTAFFVAVALGGLALLLTVSGLFSVLSFLVQQRTKEIGVRMALGASARDVARLIVIESGRPVLLGAGAGLVLAAGAAGALLATPVAAAVSETVQVLDPVAYLATLLVIVTASAIAAAAPALRAARVDPMITLRNE